MTAAIQALLALLSLIAPSATEQVIAGVIATLEAWVPVIVKEYQDMVPIVTNIIAALRANGAVTPAMLDQLDAQEALIDADFDDAEAKAEVADAPPIAPTDGTPAT